MGQSGNGLGYTGPVDSVLEQLEPVDIRLDVLSPRLLFGFYAQTPLSHLPPRRDGSGNGLVITLGAMFDICSGYFTPRKAGLWSALNWFCF